MKIAVLEDRAYWITNNALYTARMSDDGSVLRETEKIADTFSIPLEKAYVLFDIIDALLEDDEDE